MQSTPYTLHHGDALTALRGIASATADAVVTDPPYQVNLSEKLCPWDVWPGRDTWSEIGRVLRPDGILALIIAPHVAHARIPDVIAAGFQVLEVGFWVWNNGRPVGAGRLKRSYDLVYFCSQRGRRLQVEQARGAHRVPGHETMIRPPGMQRLGRNSPLSSTYKRGGEYYPANVACRVGSRVFGRADYERVFAVKRASSTLSGRHPTEKPLDLMQQLVKLSTPPSGVVLDPFMGRATTGAAARALGHPFIGIDSNADYVERARARLAAMESA